MPIKNLTLGLCLLMAGSVLAQGAGYKVRNGDCDWTIAKKYGITVHQLHAMNEGVNWGGLRIGLKIHVPSSADHVSRHSHSVAVKRHSRDHAYTVREGDNDWILAHRAGVRLTVLKDLNPGLDLSDLHPGQHIKLPGGVSTAQVAVHRIHYAYAVVNTDSVTIRREAGVHAGTICTVDQGTRAAVLDRDGAWYQLRFPKGTVGWVRGDLLNPAYATRVARRRRHSEGYVATSRRRHHSRSRNHGIDGTYVASEAGDAVDILQKATSMRGVRYRWGEASRSGTDCSGFTTQVFRSQGVKLPRTSSEQAYVGQKVDYKHLKPGDLVFFHTVRGRRVSHVGIYMGHGKFIHASSGGGQVQVNSLAEGYYSHRLVTARRVAAKAAHHTPKKAVVAEQAPVTKTPDAAPSDNK